MDVEADTLPSPFLRKYLPKEWKRLTPGERLDKKMKEAREETLMLASRNIGKMSSRAAEPSSRTNLRSAASAPMLQGIRKGTSTAKEMSKTTINRIDSFAAVLSQIDSPHFASTKTLNVKSDEKKAEMRKRMHAKLA